MQQEKTPLDYLSVLEFRGHDASQFLHGQLSAEVRNLEGEEAGFAGVCNPSGRLLGLLLCRRTDDGFLAICAAELRDDLQEWLGKFVLRARVEIQARTDLRVQGLASAGPTETGSVFVSDFASYLVSAAADPVAGEASVDRGALTRWRARELSSGVVWMSPGTSGQFLPQMLGLERIGALSFNKGCYPGQEVIARTHYLGKLKRRPLLMRLNERIDPPVMAELELEADGETATAALIERVALPESRTLLLSVARMDQEFRPRTLSWQQGRYPVEWSGPPGENAG